MPLQLKKDERSIIESSTRYLGEEGSLILTDKRLIFYVVIKEYLKSTQYDMVFDVPLNYITGVSFKGYGFSTLIVETDSKVVSGNPRHDFFLIDAHKWVDLIKRYQNSMEAKRSQSRTQQGLGFPPVRTVPPASGRAFSKLCLNCMSVIPEGVRICPKCGEYL